VLAENGADVTARLQLEQAGRAYQGFLIPAHSDYFLCTLQNGAVPIQSNLVPQWPRFSSRR